MPSVPHYISRMGSNNAQGGESSIELPAVPLCLSNPKWLLYASSRTSRPESIEMEAALNRTTRGRLLARLVRITHGSYQSPLLERGLLPATTFAVRVLQVWAYRGRCTWYTGVRSFLPPTRALWCTRGVWIEIFFVDDRIDQLNKRAMPCAILTHI